jgi:hypothetical protein
MATIQGVDGGTAEEAEASNRSPNAVVKVVNA